MQHACKLFMTLTSTCQTQLLQCQPHSGMMLASTSLDNDGLHYGFQFFVIVSENNEMYHNKFQQEQSLIESDHVVMELPK